MAIHGGSLYVSDIDALVQIDLSSGKTTARHPAPGAVFLNDVAAGTDGSIYAGDSSNENSVIQRLCENKLEDWLKSPSIRNPNGLHVEG